ncbi:ABC transporter permease subunit [Paludicola sp. MB14-C6]|uniref:ABC transporter permease subunit n=1 Tax=Paludihabitans sp. MB14-C6 TaxID=3070656 RepID=UPI0027DCA596|nr:ABC transporter permease subunit [Paludicola sp. MB14-C6]WMJ23979.1 ABC transporter permease subunit [Paludicola sp. MB14-C6]
MFSLPLLKRTIRSNYIVFLIFAAVITMYFTLIVGMYSPETQETMQKLMATMPKEMMSAFGFDFQATTLIGFLASYLYGFIMLIFVMVYGIIVSNRLIAKHVDRGSMAYFLSTPNTRIKIAVTQAAFLLASVTIMVSYATVLGIICSEATFPGKLDIPTFVYMNFGVLLLHFALTGIGFFASCLFNDTKNSLAIGARLPIAFYIIQMLANTGEKLENFKYASIFTLFNPNDIIAGADGVGICFTILGSIAVVLYGAGMWVFHKRDLPL